MAEPASVQTSPVAVVTGASSGIGREAAKALLAAGWRVIATGRDPERTAAAEARLRAEVPGGDLVMLRADLAVLAEVAALADRIAELTPRLDLLLNNAGGMASEQVMTSEGLEANFAGNHVGPFLLTERLLPLLRAAAKDAPRGRVRIINTSSDASEMIPGFRLDDIQNLENWSVGAAYCTSKLCNVLHAKALAGRLASDGIVAHSMHPGTVGSNFFNHVGEATRAYTDTLEKLSEADGADTLIWLALADEPGQSSGGYWYCRAPRTPNPLIDNAEFVEGCWRATRELLAAKGY